MSVDLAELRRLAEAAAKHPPLPAADQPLDAKAYDAWFDAWRGFRNTVTPVVFLELLDRLERAEKKLAERDTVYPTLMTQVGKEQKP